MAEIFPYSIWSCAWLAPLAICMDLLFGDPRLPWPHPVVIIGRALNRIEKRLRKIAAEREAWLEKPLGALAVLLVAGGSFLLVRFLIQLPWIGIFFAIYFAWAGLAMGCLASAGREAVYFLNSGDLEEGRRAVSWLVSRDVSQLERPMLFKTLADTLSENFTDAFMAPYFWLLLSGPAGLWAYKAVSTMDSQWGYLTPAWKNAGWAAARSDDLLAFIPARLSVIFIYLGDRIASVANLRAWHGYWPGFKRVASDARGMPSPNSGWSMAACAWLAKGAMAGPSVYFGELVKKPWLGPKGAPPWNSASIRALLRVMYAGCLTAAVALWLFLALLSALI